MEVFWAAIFTALTFIALAESSQKVLVNKPGCDSCSWDWENSKFKLEEVNIIGVS